MLKKINKVLLELEKLDTIVLNKLVALSDFQLKVLFYLKKDKIQKLDIASLISLKDFKQSRTQKYREINELIKLGFCKKKSNSLILLK